MDNQKLADAWHKHREERGWVEKPRWWDTKKGHPLFRRYFWALMLGLSIASMMRECRQLWRATVEGEVGE